METSKRCVLILTVPMVGAESVPIQELSRVLTARKLEPNPKPKFNEAGGGAQSFFFLFALAPIHTRPELKKTFLLGRLLPSLRHSQSICFSINLLAFYHE